MDFNKILAINVDEAQLSPSHLAIIDTLSKKRIHLAKDSNKIVENLNDTDCLLVGFGVKIDKNTIDNTPNLKYIGMFGTGYGNIDAKYAKSKKIVVCNVPNYSTESVAELVFAVILEQLRELETAKKQARNKNYSDAGFSPTEIKNKKFGILGLGNIGKRVAELALCFGADIGYWSKNRKIDIESKGITYENADDLISKSDFLTLHLSHTNDTENFLDKNRIQKIKKGAIVINTSPMELVDINALEIRLKSKDITFILDHSDEMTKENLEMLSKYPNCIIYPPIGCITKEAEINKQEIFVKNIKNFVRDTPTNNVN